MTSQYTKELMKHFRYPKFVKKIKNPDGIGEVGNIKCGDIMRLEIKIEKNKIKDIGFHTFGCLPPNEKVIVKEGDWVNVNSVYPNQITMNSDGCKTRIVENNVRDYNGNLLTIIPFVSNFNSFSVTPEHPILCIKRKSLKFCRKSSNKCNWLRINQKELLSVKPDFIKAEKLEKSDYLIFVSNKKTKDIKLFTIDIMKLIGYYLAEGYPSSKDSVVNFSFHANEREYINEVKKLLKKVTKKEPKERTRNNVTEIYICSRKWVNFFINMCGKYAKHKKLSKEILTLPVNKQWNLIESYIKGDGNIYKRRIKDSPTYRITTASINLSIQIQQILARKGIFASIKKDKRIREKHKIEGRKVIYNQYYEISFKLERKKKFYHNIKNHLLIPIKNIKIDKFKGKVYNFQVSGKPSSYLVKGFAVHNCPAAVASSDVVCGLAKGKTLEKAEKLTKDDIIKKLKKMPPIKIHCSVLGIEALKKAIGDYKNKGKKLKSRDIL